MSKVSTVETQQANTKVSPIYELLGDSLQFSSENQEVWEEALHSVSLLVQLYGGDGDDCLSPACLRSFQRLLRAHVQDDTLRMQRTALRIIKRLVSSVNTHCWANFLTAGSQWLVKWDRGAGTAGDGLSFFGEPPRKKYILLDM